MVEADEDHSTAIVPRTATDAAVSTFWERVPDALRGRGTGDVDLVPWMRAGLVLALVGGSAIGYLDRGTAAGAVEGLGWGLVFYLLAVASLVSARMEAYGGGDEELAAEELADEELAADDGRPQ